MAIYMDNAASTKVRSEVLQTFDYVAEHLYANPSSEHSEGLKAERYINNVKENIADKFNCSPDEIFFTTGATMSNNLLIQGMLRKHPETMFITSTVEHNDIMMLYDWLPYTKRLVDVNENGVIDICQLAKYIQECIDKGIPCLVSIQMANSETGIIQPIKLISDILHLYEYGYLHVDATQYIPYYPIDIDELGIDALSMSGQKIGGIKGSGLLYVCQVLQNNISPIIFGEQGLIGGTPSTPLIASLGAAFDKIDYIDNISLFRMRNYLLSRLKDLGGILVGTDDDCRRLPNNIYIRFPGVNGLTLMHLLSDKGIYIGTGSACSTDSDKPSHVALAYGLSEEEAFECVRFTLSPENTEGEIDYVIDMLKSILPLL